MDITTIILIGMVLALAAGNIARLIRNTRIRPIVLVVTKSGDTIRGALKVRRTDRIELDGAELLDQGKATPIDGTTHIDRRNIRWMQEPS